MVGSSCDQLMAVVILTVSSLSSLPPSVTASLLQVCFAVLNYLPPLRAQVHYYAGNGRVGMDVNFNLQTCQDWPNSFDGSWSYVCVDLRSCLNQYVDPEGQMFQVNSLTFDGGTFWVDEVAIAAGAPEG